MKKLLAKLMTVVILLPESFRDGRSFGVDTTDISHNGMDVSQKEKASKTPPERDSISSAPRCCAEPVQTNQRSEIYGLNASVELIKAP